MDSNQVNKIFESFSSVKALVIGDLMIDSYIWGKVERISPEAPVPVVSVSKRERRLGGAANVGLNINALGAKVILCGVVGDDEEGHMLRHLLAEKGMSDAGVYTAHDRPTTTKTRVIGNAHQLLRIDAEETKPISVPDEQGFIQHIESLFSTENIGVIIFEDYDKGAITPGIIERITNLAHNKGIPVTVDPKKRNFLAYKNVDLFKPNLKELREGLKVDIDAKDAQSVTAAIEKLAATIHSQKVLLTLSEHGIWLRTKEGKDYKFPAHQRDIVDVSGAGDTVISVASLLIALKVEDGFVTWLSNLAGGLVCEKIGVVPIHLEELKREALAKLSLYQ